MCLHLTNIGCGDVEHVQTGSNKDRTHVMPKVLPGFSTLDGNKPSLAGESGHVIVPDVCSDR